MVYSIGVQRWGLTKEGTDNVDVGEADAGCHDGIEIRYDASDPPSSGSVGWEDTRYWSEETGRKRK